MDFFGRKQDILGVQVEVCEPFYICNMVVVGFSWQVPRTGSPG